MAYAAARAAEKPRSHGAFTTLLAATHCCLIWIVITKTIKKCLTRSVASLITIVRARSTASFWFRTLKRVYPTYDFTRHLRADETVYAESKRVIIIEGILLFDFPEIVNLLDMKIFVDTDADVRILRRLVRDVSERGRSIDSVVSQYLNTVKPMHEKYIEPTKRLADVIVPEGGQNDVAYEMIVNSVLKKISR